MTVMNEALVLFSLDDETKARFEQFLRENYYVNEPREDTMNEKALLDLIQSDQFEEFANEAKMDVSPVGTPGGRQNWVDHVGGLPLYIRGIAHALIRNGHTEGNAIQLAVAAVKRWAHGGDGVKPDTVAKAAAALAEWEAKKGASHIIGAARHAAHAASRSGGGSGSKSAFEVVQHALEVKAAAGAMETKVRHVRTPEGMRRFHEPIGSPIVGGGGSADWAARASHITSQGNQ